MTSVALEDVAQIVQGGRHGLSGNDFVSRGYPAYGAGGLNGYLATFEFDETAIVLSSIGARCGKCFLPKGKWTSLANTQIIRPDAQLADARFLWFQLNDEGRWPRSGTGQPFIKPSDVKSHIVELPQLSEQRRVAGVLEQADRLRRTRRYALELSDSFLPAAFRQLFCDGYKRFPVKSLDDVVQPDRGVTYGIVQAGPHIDGGIPYIRTGDIIDGEIRSEALLRTSREIADAYKRSEVKYGDLIVSIRATVGTIARLPRLLDGANLTQGTARIAPGKLLDRDFLVWQIRSASTQRWITQQVKGSTFLEITLGRLREMPVFVPPLALQQQFASLVSRHERLRAVQRESLRQAEHLFQSLLHRAFTK